MKFTEDQREKLIFMIQAGICTAALLFSIGSLTADQRKLSRKKRKLTEKQERKLGKTEYRFQKKLLKQAYRKKLEKK
ncbi:MAG: hypothetical protein SOZ59_08640 [Candidatus Limivivens sp.]|nr:hypothetical protein [Candidatus Limivivens sp.]